MKGAASEKASGWWGSGAGKLNGGSLKNTEIPHLFYFSNHIIRRKRRC